MFGCAKARLCGVDPMDPQHHIIYLSLFFVNEHGTTQRDSGKETTVLFWYILFPTNTMFLGLI